MTYTARIVGTPIPQPRHRVGAGFSGHPRAYLPPDHPVHAWKQVIVFGWRSSGQRAPLAGQLELRLTFRLPRPARHYGKGRNASRLLPSAPAGHAQTPDVDNLTKAVMDALTTARAWADDAQVAFLTVSKVWCSPGEAPGVLIVLSAMESPTSADPG